MNDKPVLVDQAGLDERADEPHAALDEQVPVGVLLLEARDGGGQVAAGDCRGAPLGGGERVGEHDLGDLVHRRRERPRCIGPEAGPHRIGRRTDEVRAGVAHRVEDPLGAVGRTSHGDPVVAAVSRLDVAVERDGHLQNE